MFYVTAFGFFVFSGFSLRIISWTCSYLLNACDVVGLYIDFCLGFGAFAFQRFVLYIDFLLELLMSRPLYLRGTDLPCFVVS